MTDITHIISPLQLVVVLIISWSKNRVGLVILIVKKLLLLTIPKSPSFHCKTVLALILVYDDATSPSNRPFTRNRDRRLWKRRADQRRFSIESPKPASGHGQAYPFVWKLPCADPANCCGTCIKDEAQSDDQKLDWRSNMVCEKHF